MSMRTRSELLSDLAAAGIEAVLIEHAAGWAVVTPSLGARVLGAGIGEDNALWSAPRLVRAGWAEGGNAGGERTWIAPEGGPHGFFFIDDPARWAVPVELDPGAYVAVPDSDGWHSWECRLTARCLDGARFPVAITRSVRVVGQTPRGVLRVELRSTLTNRGDVPLEGRPGLWCIAQCPCEEPGTIHIGLASGCDTRCVHPYFAPLPRGLLSDGHDTAVLSMPAGVKLKVGCSARAATGCVGFLGSARGRPFACVMRTPVDAAGEYLDGPFMMDPGCRGDAVQAYHDPGIGPLAFCELEVHAPAARLLPAGRRSMLVTMSVVFGPQAAGVIGSLLSETTVP